MNQSILAPTLPHTCRQTHSVIQPLRKQLEQLRREADERRSAIAQVKTRIVQNDERVQDILARTLEKVH